MGILNSLLQYYAIKFLLYIFLMKIYKLYKPFLFPSFMIHIVAIFCIIFTYVSKWFTSGMQFSNDLKTGISKNCTFFLFEKNCEVDHWSFNKDVKIHNFTNYTLIYDSVPMNKTACLGDEDCIIRINFYKEFKFIGAILPTFCTFYGVGFLLLLMRLYLYHKRVVNRIIWFCNFGISLLSYGLNLITFILLIILNMVYFENYIKSDEINTKQGFKVLFVNYTRDSGVISLIIIILLTLAIFILSYIEAYKFSKRYFNYQPYFSKIMIKSNDTIYNDTI